MEEKAPVQIRLSEIGQRGVALDESLDTGWLSQVLVGDLPSAFRPTEASRMSGRIRRMGDDVLVDMSGSLSLSAECASCLKGIALSVPVDFSVTLSPARGAEKAPAEDQELTREELGHMTYEGDMVVLDALLREQIILALPMFPRCSESCAGLCVKCGADLNTVDCGCERTEIDPRFAALKQVKL
jgi:uncharacterized protein